MKSGDLNFLKYSGLHQTYNDTALPLRKQLDTNFTKNYFSLCLPQNRPNTQRLLFNYNLFRNNTAAPLQFWNTGIPDDFELNAALPFPGHCLDNWAGIYDNPYCGTRGVVEVEEPAVCNCLAARTWSVECRSFLCHLFRYYSKMTAPNFL